MEKLEKFMSGKPVAEQEIGALLQEVVAYAETSMSRRKFFYCIILVKNLIAKLVMVLIWTTMFVIKTKVEAKDKVVKLLEVVRDTKHL